MGILSQLLSSDFMPHGYCYLWDPWIVWLNVVSDGLITLSYYCIPLVLIYFARKNRDVTSNRIFWMFGAFILACGTTHLMEVWNVWHASYVLSGIVKAVTAVASVLTAAMVVPLVPQAIALPARIRLEEVNRQIELRIAERKRLDDELSQASLGLDDWKLSSTDPRLVEHLGTFTSAAAAFSALVGLSGLAGWRLHIAALSTWGAGPVKMVPNTSACFVLFAISLWSLRRREDYLFAATRKLIAKGAAVIAGLVGLLSLAEHIAGADFGIDQLLVAVSSADRLTGLQPGLMSSITAVDFFLLGIAVLLLDWKTRRGDWPAQFLCLCAMTGAAFGVIALVLEPNASYTSMALPTVVTFFVLASGLVTSRATWALGGLLTSSTPGSRLLRRATPIALLVLGLIGWSISKALLTEVRYSWVEVSALAILCSAMLAGFIAWIAFVVDRSEAERRKIEAALNVSQEQLERLMDRFEEPEAEAVLRRRATLGFTVAVVLTGVLGFLSWRNAKQAAEDADWVAHTHEVLATLEATLRHLLEVESGARGFALSGNKLFLESYDSGRHAAGQDLQALRLLIVDPDQARRLGLLREQANARIEASEARVASRSNSGTIPAAPSLERGRQIMDAARTTVEQMEDAERQLLAQRTQRTRTAQRVTSSVILAGSLLGVVFLSIAGGTVHREIGVSAKARAQVSALNADLERRVEQRTEALGESEGRLAGVIQSAMDAIITVDEQQNILLFNAAAEKMFGSSPKDALGTPIERFIPQCFRAVHAAHIGKFSQSGVTSRSMGLLGKVWGVRANGEDFPIEASISQVEAGGKKLFTVILRDITERQRAEATRLRLASIVESTDSAILSKDLSGIITSWNKGAEVLYGYREDEVLGKHINLIIPPKLQEEELHFLLQVAEGKLIRHAETLRRRKDGTLVSVSSIVSPVRNSGGKVIGASAIAQDITERKRAEAALQEKDHLLSESQRIAHIGSWRLDLKDPAGLLAWSEEMYRIYGVTADAFIPTVESFLDLIAPEDQHAMQKWIAACAAGQRPGDLEFRVILPDGTIRFISGRGELQRDAENRPAQLTGSAQDITERKLAEDALRDSEERFQAMANGIPQLAWMAEADGSIFWYNQRWYDYTGTTFQQMQGWGWQSVHDPNMLPAVMERWKGAIAAGKPFEMEFPLRRADGVFRMFLTRIVPVKDAEGSVTRWFGTNTDISERKQVEERLAGQAEELTRQTDELLRSRKIMEEQTLMLQSVLDSMEEGLVVADRQGKFVIWNPAAERIVGLGAADIPSQDWTEHYGLYLADTMTPFPSEQNPLARAIQGEITTAEIFVRNPELAEGVWIEASGHPLKGADGVQHGGVVAFRDITQKKNADREIKELNEELEHRVIERTAQLEAANRELEAFTYSVSHDLRAPLRHIAGFAGILVEEFGPKLEPQAQHYLTRIIDGTRKMGQLVDELLTLARVGRQIPNLQVAGLDSIVAEVVALLMPEYEGRKVEWKIAQLPFVECDPMLMKLVFQNLISNALKYSRPRAEAVIEIGQIGTKDGKNAIFVRDNGVGFSMKYSNKLFGVFQRLHRAEDFEGTGVGLATVQRIIHKHGGRVWAEAELDRGASFYFTLSGAERSRESEAAGALGARA